MILPLSTIRFPPIVGSDPPSVTFTLVLIPVQLPMIDRYIGPYPLQLPMIDLCLSIFTMHSPSLLRTIDQLTATAASGEKLSMDMRRSDAYHIRIPYIIDSIPTGI